MVTLEVGVDAQISYIYVMFNLYINVNTEVIIC